MKINKDEITQRFLGLRNNLELTQQEASKLFGVALSTWQSWEYGTHAPNIPTVKLLEIYEKTAPERLNVPELCKSIRGKLAMTKTAMATLFGVDVGSWSDWEKGKIKPNTQNTERLQQIFKDLQERETLQKAS